MHKLMSRPDQSEFPFFAATIIAIILVVGFASMMTEQPVCKMFDVCCIG